MAWFNFVTQNNFFFSSCTIMRPFWMYEKNKKNEIKENVLKITSRENKIDSVSSHFYRFVCFQACTWCMEKGR